MAFARILVVDDEESVLLVARGYLEAAGYLVDTAVSGMAALELAARNSYAAAILDCRMPEMNGLELHTRLEAEHPKLAARTIFASGTVGHSSVRGSPFLSKPFSSAELLRAVRSVIGIGGGPG